jgi:molybdate transport system regulatory protein
MRPATNSIPRLVVRLKLGGDSVLGPGKVDLLERIDRCGSISAAAREMEMSYRQAWMLIDTLNQAFGRPVIETTAGGRSGGGARLTSRGKRIVAGYRALQAKVAKSTRNDVEAIVSLMASSAGRRDTRRR